MQAEAKGVAIFIEIVFLLIFFCNIPFIFFAGKGALFGAIKIIFYPKKDAALGEEDDQVFEATEVSLFRDQATQNSNIQTSNVQSRAASVSRGGFAS